MTQPQRDPFLPDDKQPLMGYSTIPPHRTCALWTKRRKARKEDGE